MPKQTFFNLAAEKRERILDVAIDEFAQNDYSNVSISKIVQRAGIAKGSFYQYFEDKEDLYAYLLGLMAEEKQKFLESEPPDPQMGIFAFLRWLAREGVRFELKNPRLGQIAYRAVTGAGYPPSFVAQYQAQGLAFFRALVAQGKAQGDIAPEIDDDLAAFMFNTIFTELGRHILQRFPQRPDTESGRVDDLRAFFDGDEVQAIFSQTLAILQHGLAPTGASGVTEEYENESDGNGRRSESIS
ncbi:MAG TPA: TetR/AcrR family transcriptional regulator [Candidatus Sulfomarinibacteraceae bacterium]|nr:TetR/AcrR family transcriptional regulator [Candidatus Sulfomarinibacteraceae bacterium]